MRRAAVCTDRLEYSWTCVRPASDAGGTELPASCAVGKSRLYAVTRRLGRSPAGPRSSRPNRLQREVTVEKPDQVWVTDITYIRTWQGWLYLAVVMDLYARRIVGWSMKPTLAREIVIDAILMAVWRRRPRGT